MGIGDVRNYLAWRQQWIEDVLTYSFAIVSSACAKNGEDYFALNCSLLEDLEESRCYEILGSNRFWSLDLVFFEAFLQWRMQVINVE